VEALAGDVKDYSTQAFAFLLDITSQLEKEQLHPRLMPGCIDRAKE